MVWFLNCFLLTAVLLACCRCFLLLRQCFPSRTSSKFLQTGNWAWGGYPNLLIQTRPLLLTWWSAVYLVTSAAFGRGSLLILWFLFISRRLFILSLSFFSLHIAQSPNGKCTSKVPPPVLKPRHSQDYHCQHSSISTRNGTWLSRGDVGWAASLRLLNSCPFLHFSPLSIRCFLQGWAPEPPGWTWVFISLRTGNLKFVKWCLLVILRACVRDAFICPDYWFEGFWEEGTQKFGFRQSPLFYYNLEFCVFK